jgi:hypothetical protein
MRKLDSEQEIISLAAGLRVDWQKNAVENIIALCHAKISKWLKGHPKVQSIGELEKLVCDKVKLVFEEIWTDDDLKKVIQKYVKMGEPIFATLTHDLNKETFATLIERRKVDATSQDRYVAVVDCRGVKSAKKFFTRWHEIAHLLTLQGQLELPLHRSTSHKTPTERLMDVIAGEIGFYEPLFGPLVTGETSRDGKLTFETVERIRLRFCPEASFHATLNACAKRLKSPALVLVVGMGFKKKEEDQLKSQQSELLPIALPKAKLRVLSVASNALAAGSRLQIHRNMQVPSSSLLHKLFIQGEGSLENEIEGRENLRTWLHSDGSCLANVEVQIHARRIQDSLVVLISQVG